SAVDYDYWRRMLRLVQTAHELPTNITISDSSQNSQGSQGAEPTVPRAPTPSTSLVHRQPRRPAAHIVACPAKPDARFADYVRVRAGGAPGADPSGSEPPRAFCILAGATLFGFAAEHTGASDAASLRAAAAFTVDLRGARVQQINEQRAGGTVYVVCVLGLRTDPELAECAQQDEHVLFAFELRSRDRCTQWTDALRAIGGIESVDVCVRAADPFDSAPPLDITAMSIRRSRSFVSSISRAEWPMPPASLPSRKANPLAEPSGRAGNPSLDAVGMRLDLANHPPSQSQRSRFPWFRRKT
ncbi:hypothetical protein LPJ70_004108, partial [Coemansia sp. RSA 2708]